MRVKSLQVKPMRLIVSLALSLLSIVPPACAQSNDGNTYTVSGPGWTATRRRNPGQAVPAQPSGTSTYWQRYGISQVQPSSPRRTQPPAQPQAAGQWQAQRSYPAGASAPTGVPGYPDRRSAPGRAVPTERPAARTGASTYDFADSVMSQGRQRTYRVHVPRSYTGRTPMPLVLAFHGYQMTGTAMRAVSLLDITSESNGFIVVYPDGVDRRWGDAPFSETGIDDVAFVDAMLKKLHESLRIDDRRIFACGISNGGKFVQKLACDMSNRIAAIAVVAASGLDKVLAGCQARRAIPIVFFMGSEDPLIPREGEARDLGKAGEFLGLADVGITTLGGNVGSMAGLYTAANVIEYWSKHNNCPPAPRSETLPDRHPEDGCRVRRDYYGPGSSGSEVIVYTVDGGGHTWPGGAFLSVGGVFGRTTQDISASQLMWDFFARHSM